MLNVKIRSNEIRKFKGLQLNKYESNGQITVSKDGEIVKISDRPGQIMQKCVHTCILNYHTHPSDYVNLYPDHPSPTDMKYIFSATCTYKELGSHLIFTPKYVYVLRYKCKNPLQNLLNFFRINSKIDKLFDDLKREDRSTELFRQKWMQGLRDMGFEIQRFEYDKVISFQTPHHSSSITATYIFLFILFSIFIYFFLKK